MTVVTILANVQYIVFTFATKPNLDVANTSPHHESCPDISKQSFIHLYLSFFGCLISIGSNLNVSKCDKLPNARTMTVVTILANVQYTVFTFALNPNLNVANTSPHHESCPDISKKVLYTYILVSLVV